MSLISVQPPSVIVSTCAALNASPVELDISGLGLTFDPLITSDQIWCIPTPAQLDGDGPGVQEVVLSFDNLNSLTLAVGTGFGDPTYNDSYAPTGTHNGQPYYTGVAHGRVAYYDAANDLYALDTAIRVDGTAAAYQSDVGVHQVNTDYTSALGTPPGGTISLPASAPLAVGTYVATISITGQTPGTASGFGDNAYNGILRQVGLHDGQPLYETLSGRFFYWNNFEWVGNKTIVDNVTTDYVNGDNDVESVFSAQKGLAPGGVVVLGGGTLVLATVEVTLYVTAVPTPPPVHRHHGKEYLKTRLQPVSQGILGRGRL